MRRGKFVRWGVPIAAVAVIGAAIGTGPVIAAVSGEPTLPERSAAQLLADAAGAVKKDGGLPPMSGTVQQTASLGLPALPMGGDASSPTSMLSGSREIKVWYGSQDKLRIALPTQMSETNLIVNGDQTWYWNSDDNVATKIKVKAGSEQEHKMPAPTPSDLTPQQAAEKVLAAAGKDTDIRVTNTDQVAGRAVYQLVLAPKDQGSLVQEVRIAIDGETYVPLRVQVFAKGSPEAAFEVKFTEVTFTPPAEENFTFTPPAGAKVEEKTLNDEQPSQAQQDKAADLQSKLKFVGSGWTSVAVLPFSAADLKAPAGAEKNAGQDAGGAALVDSVLKAATPVSGTWGSGKLIKTKLVTALLTDDGRLLIGAVTPEELQEAAGAK